MKNTSLKLLNNLDDFQLNLYQFIAKVFDNLRVPYLIVGARARDLILEGVYNINCPRATLDTDLAIMLKTWDEFFEVKNKFINLGDFETVLGVDHRISSPIYGIIDFIPFGGISNNGEVKWPPEYSSLMNVVGFDDAYKCSISVAIDDKINIRCCSLVGLSILKLIALNDRKYITKDADDLAFIMMNYSKAGQHKRIFQEFSDLIAEDFDYDCTSMRLLGRDIVQAASQACLKQLSKILDAQILCENNLTLVTALSKINLSFEDNITRAVNLLKALRMELLLPSPISQT